MAQGQSPVSCAMRVRLVLACSALLGVLFSIVPAGGAQAREVVLPVARVTVYPGTVITEDMLATRAFSGKDYDQPGFAMSSEAVVGKVARKTLVPNLPIATAGLREPFSIVQGQTAVVIFKSGGLMISGIATPLQNGSVGEVVSLRNSESGVTIRGVVQADGTVRVGP